jgi:hypothetical protein
LFAAIAGRVGGGGVRARRRAVASDVLAVGSGEFLMSDRMLAGGLAAVAAILTLFQLLWMFGMFSPADALAGRTGFIYASMLAAWFLFTLALLVAAAVILLMATDDKTV